VSFHQYSGGKEGKRKRGLVAVGAGGMEYRGTALESKHSSKYIVAVYKPSKGKLYLMDAGHVVPLRQGNIRDAEADEATEKAAVANRAEESIQYNRQAAKQALVEGFGSRRKASDMSIKRSNVVSTDNIQSRDAVIALLKNTAAATTQAPVKRRFHAGSYRFHADSCRFPPPAQDDSSSLGNRPPHNLQAEARYVPIW